MQRPVLRNAPTRSMLFSLAMCVILPLFVNCVHEIGLLISTAFKNRLLPSRNFRHNSALVDVLRNRSPSLTLNVQMERPTQDHHITSFEGTIAPSENDEGRDGRALTINEERTVEQRKNDGGDDEYSSQRSLVTGGRSCPESAELPAEPRPSEKRSVSDDLDPLEAIFVCRSWPTSQKKVERYVARYLHKAHRRMEGEEVESAKNEFSMMTRFREDSEQYFPWDAIAVVLR
ncbi:hypothetical protein FN846DRAFT_927210 [Sphaerosporella brunnea]|uniref:Uncharacterized protein n=1 Tax=Sphaerosporella brunnea TaxID=1250544 RepID=A0A5J5FBA8_9PEZI|nr:hypothetical protein FN846DRAFT_927210 [Sphaerosporella brunnea]